MKKLGLIVGGLILLVLIALLVLPMLFKDKVAALLTEKANQSLNAQVEIGKVELGLLSTFPNLTAKIDGLRIINRTPFEGDTLAAIDRISMAVNLTRLIFGGEVRIQSLKIESPTLFLIALKDGTVNWDIVPQSPAEAATESQNQKMLDLVLKKYEISRGRIKYYDEKSGLQADIRDLNHGGSGDFSKKVFTLTTTTTASIASLKSGGVTLLKEAGLDWRSNIGVDLNQARYDIKECRLKINEMAFSSTGWLKSDGRDLTMEISLDAPGIGFRDLLSMLPQIPRTDLADLEATGSVAVSGRFSGIYNQERLPAIELQVSVDNGSFRFRRRQVSVDDVGIDLQIGNPGGTYDATTIDLRRLHFAILGKPVEIRLTVKTPISDPYLDGLISGGLDLSRVRQVIPSGDSLDLSGTIHGDLSFRGNLSAIEKRQFNRFFASGRLTMDSIRYETKSIPEPITINTAQLLFRPEVATLKQFDMRIGGSDIQAEGSLENIFGYLFGGRILGGTLDVKSNSLDLNPFLKQEGGAIAAVELPDRVEFSMTGLFKRLYLTNQVIDNLQGRLTLKDRTLYLENLSGGFLEGSVNCRGTYRFVPPEKPKIDLELKLADMSIPAMFSSVTTVKALAPVAGYMAGSLSGELKLSSELGDSLAPDLGSLSAAGSLRIPKAAIEGFPPLTKVADILKMEKLRNPTLTNFAPDISIENGRFHFKPVNIEIGGYQVVASGSNGIDKTIDYSLKLHVPAGEISADGGSPIARMLKTGTGLLPDQTVVVDVGLKGKLEDPDVSTSIAEVLKGTAAQIKQEVLQQVEQQKQQIEQQAQQRLQESKEAAEDSLKKELERKAKQEKEKVKDKLKGLFGK